MLDKSISCGSGRFRLDTTSQKSIGRLNKSLFYLPYLSFILWCVMICDCFERFGFVLFASLRNQFTGDASFYPPLRKKGRSERSVTLHRLIVMPENSIEVGTPHKIHGWFNFGNSRCWCLAITFWGAFQALWGDVVLELFPVSGWPT